MLVFGGIWSLVYGDVSWSLVVFSRLWWCVGGLWSMVIWWCLVVFGGI